MLDVGKYLNALSQQFPKAVLPLPLLAMGVGRPPQPDVGVASGDLERCSVVIGIVDAQPYAVLLEYPVNIASEPGRVPELEGRRNAHRQSRQKQFQAVQVHRKVGGG